MDVGIKNLPKKQFVGAFLLILFMAGGVLFVKNSSGEKSPEKGGLVAVTDTENAFANEAQKDTDNDGLKDWEEDLWKTDKTNSDTDGDGTPDGEEVRNKRNPTKAGPGDEYKSIEESPLGDIAKEIEAEKNLTLTDIFARDFMSGYFALKDAGQYTNETRDKFIKTLFASVDTLPAEEKYTLADLTITEKSDVETLKNYGNEVSGILRRFYESSLGDELRILDNAVKKEDADELHKLEQFAERYKKLATDLLKTKTPFIVADTHLGFLSGYRGLGEALSGMTTILNDPMGGTAYVKKYQDNTEFIDKAFADLKSYFSRAGVRFTPEEYGYIFTI